MPPIQPQGPLLGPLGPPVGASSEDDNIPAVQGTSLTPNSNPLAPPSEKWFLGGGTGVSGASGSGAGMQATSDTGVGLHAVSQGTVTTIGQQVAAVFAEGGNAYGALVTTTGGAAGVMAVNTGAGPGVESGSGTGAGVIGTSTTGPGVAGKSTSGTGVEATSGNGIGLQATSNTGVGLQATSQTQDGIQGVSSAPPHAGVSGTNLGGGFGLWAASDATGGTGIFARGQANAAIFDGHVQINGNHAVTGTITVQTDIVLANADCAEEFDVADQAGPGTVMVIGDDEALRPSAEAYDRRVAGVVSGGGEYKPALLLDRRTSARPRSAVALVGKVCCKVDADHGPVRVGDLLTTSPTPGHAMRASDRDRAFGAVIGKALQALQSGQGLIPILVALQ
jgi:hypothetical protein